MRWGRWASELGPCAAAYPGTAGVTMRRMDDLAERVAAGFIDAERKRREKVVGAEVLEIDLAGVLAEVEMVPSRAGIKAGVKAAPIERLLWRSDMLKNIPSCASVRRSGKREN